MTNKHETDSVNEPASKPVSSRLPGFHRLSVEERRRTLAAAMGRDTAELSELLSSGGLSVEVASHMSENVIGTYSLPLALATNVRVNGSDYLVPMAVEEPSVVAAVSHASGIVRRGGEFKTETDAPIMIAQVELRGVGEDGERTLAAATPELLELANSVVPGIVARGGGAQEIELRRLGDNVILHLLVDCRDAMGANLVNTAAEAIAPRASELSGGDIGLRILTNLADRRCVRVRVSIPEAHLAFGERSGADVAEGIELASRFAEADPYRAATHNKGILNGVDAVVIATGNDWRAVEAGAHAYAASSGRYRPLCVWSREGDQLLGSLEMPLALGTVGGTSSAHPTARLALEILGTQTADELMRVVGAVGMAANLAALRALSTEGIQRGHMALHASAVAIAAGATGSLVDEVAQRMREQGNVSRTSAASFLAQLVKQRSAEE